VNGENGWIAYFHFKIETKKLAVTLCSFNGGGSAFGGVILPSGRS